MAGVRFLIFDFCSFTPPIFYFCVVDMVDFVPYTKYGIVPYLQ